MPAQNRKYRTGTQASSCSVPAPCAHHTSAGYEVGMRRAVCLVVGLVCRSQGPGQSLARACRISAGAAASSMLTRL